VRLVIKGAQIPSWSPDGDQIAFTYGTWRVADWALNLDAAVVDIDSTGRRLSDLRPIVVGYHEDFTPAWSPDGRWIAYHSHRSAGPVATYGDEGSTDDIYIRRPEAPMDDEIRLTEFGWEVGVADWSPDGQKLVFTSWERGGTPRVSKPWIVTIDPETAAPLDIRPLPVPEGLSNLTGPAWSPLADEIAMLQRMEGNRQALWILKVDGGKAEKLVELQSSTYGGVDWTPDGQGLVYAALSGKRMQLFVIPRSGGQPRQLTEDAANLMHPRVSPNGQWIACLRISFN
jgi:Tol biopolymer transport system component